MKKSTSLITIVFLIFIHSALLAQPVRFALWTSPSASLVFDTIDKYRNGIVVPSYLTINVDATTQWDLYVGTRTSAVGLFDVDASYSASGISAIPVSILQLRVSNASRTSPRNNVFFNLTDITTPQYIIGTTVPDITSTCPVAGTTGTNDIGSYTSSPQCYRFKVDLKATPGLTYRPGAYSLIIDFVLVQDL